MGDPPRRSRLPLALGAVLLLLVCTALLLVLRSEPVAGPEAAVQPDTRAAAAAVFGDGARTPPRATPAPLGGGGSPPAALAPPDESPDELDRRAAESEARRRVFEGGLDGPSEFMGTRWGRRGAGGTFGVGNAPQLTGRVSDAVTGEPIAGAEVVSLFVKEQGWARRYTSTCTDENGAFRARIPLRHRETTEFLVRAPGYRAARVPHDVAPEEWRLTPVAGSGRGTIRGRAETPDGEPLAGMLLVAIQSEHGDRGDQYAWSDAGGTFELQGVRPGRWRLSLEDDRVVETTVVGNGLATARLVAERPDATLPEEPGADRRLVEVTGLADGTVLRADSGPEIFWRTVVDGGVARFELPFGLWVLTVDESDGAVQPITVRREHDARRIPFEPDSGD